MISPNKQENPQKFIKILREKGTIKNAVIGCPYCHKPLKNADISYDQNSTSHIRITSIINNQADLGYVEKTDPVSGKIETFCKHCGKKIGDVVRKDYGIKNPATLLAMAILILFIFIMAFAFKLF